MSKLRTLKNNFLSIFILSGLALFIFSIVSAKTVRPSPRPGELRAKERSLEWRSVEKLSTDSWTQGVVTFEVENCGETPVKVVSVEKGCGCVTAKMRSDLILPGQCGYLDVTASPLVIGEKRVAIRLSTDSAVTPEMAFDLRVIGTRIPPYLLSAAGDINFVDSEVGEGQVFEATTVSREGDERIPEIVCDLPFLKTERLSVVKKPSADESSVFYYINKFKLILAEKPPDGSFGGMVLINDPWVTGRVLSIPVSGRTSPEIRAIPSQFEIDTSSNEDLSRERKFIVVRRSVGRETIVEPHRPEDSPLVVDRVVGVTGDCYRIRLKADAKSRVGTFHLVVRDSRDPSSVLMLPIIIKKGSGE